jgi:hypothetical protein
MADNVCMVPEAHAARAFALGMALFFGGAARGGDGAFDASGLDVPADGYGYVATQGAKALAPGQVHASALFDWALRPLRLDSDRGGDPPGKSIVDDLCMLDLAGGVGVFQHHSVGLALGVVLPLLLRSSGFAVDAPFDRVRDSGAGNLRTDVKLQLLDRDDDVVGVALRTYAKWPTAGDVGYAANKNTAIGFDGVLEYHAGFLRTALDLGYEWLDGSASAGDIVRDDVVFASFGLGISPLSDIRGFEALEAVFEARTSFRAGNPWKREEESPVEVDGALRWSGTLYAEVGGGAGLNRGAGAPDARVFAALGATF